MGSFSVVFFLIVVAILVGLVLDTVSVPAGVFFPEDRSGRKKKARS